MNRLNSKKRVKFDDFGSLDSKKALQNLIKNLQDKYKLSKEEIFKLSTEEEINIPVSIFNKKLSSLEAIVKYLKENLKLRYNKIADLLNRDDRTIWTTYQNSISKFKGKLDVSSQTFLPISIFIDRKFSVLESVVVYLKDKLGLKFSEIAIMLARDQRTIWTVYSRARKKYEK